MLLVAIFLGTMAVISPLELHRQPDVWEDPEVGNYN